MPNGQYLRLETPGTPSTPQHVEPECAGLCASCFASVVGCFRAFTGRPSQHGGAPGAQEHVSQYRAPAVASPQRSASGASSQSECEHEQGALLPKRTATPEAGSSSAAADRMLQELPRHRHTGSGVSGRAAWTPPPEGVSRSPTPPLRSSGAVGGASSSGQGASGSGNNSSSSKQDTAREQQTGGVPAAGAAEAAAAAATSPVPIRGSSGAAAASPERAGGVSTPSPLPSSIGAMLGDESDDEDEDLCPTCLERYTEINPRVWTRCGHSFHVQCIYSWFERSDKCPLCEAQIQFDEVL